MGMQKVSQKLYDTDRHEILNETDREDVYRDLADWLNKCLLHPRRGFEGL